jgi:hypothetical protein
MYIYKTNRKRTRQTGLLLEVVRNATIIPVEAKATV